MQDAFGLSSSINRSPLLFRKAAYERLAPKRQLESLLDIGCGDPSQLASWTDFALQVVGLDVGQPEQVPTGVGFASLSESGAFPLETGSFDAAVGLFVLEHVLDLEQSIEETSRVLRPGGQAIWITTLCPDPADGDLPRLSLTHWRDFTTAECSRRPWLVPVAEVSALMAASGLRILEMSGTSLPAAAASLTWEPLLAGRASTCEQILIHAVKEGPS